MSARAILFSLLLHLAPLALLAYLNYAPKSETAAELRPREGNSSEAGAPIGDVFVTEQTEENTPASPLKEPTAPEEKSSYPAEVKRPVDPSGMSSPDSGASGTEAEPVGKIEPVYPEVSRRLGEEGEAVFILHLDANGGVSVAALEKSSGSERLDEAAKTALLQARFRVTENAGAAQSSTRRFRIEFRLSSVPHGK